MIDITHAPYTLSIFKMIPSIITQLQYHLMCSDDNRRGVEWGIDSLIPTPGGGV